MCDSNSQKYKGRVSLDIGLAAYPNCIGIKGRFAIESLDLTIEASTDRKKLNVDIYKSIGSCIQMKIIFSAPIVNNVNLLQV